ncbi:hypothetical protein HDU67_008458 [Dinochytrium kinnereticum]|nr:hypothetical protein HDU67_008458 [Dinochytrium kinnereticum]
MFICRQLKDGQAGIAKLFNAYRLYDSDYHSMSTKWKMICEDEFCNAKSLVLTQTVAVVLSPKRFPVDYRYSWSLQSLFDRTVKGACSLADTSEVRLLKTPGAPSDFTVVPSTLVEGSIKHEAVYNLKQDKNDLNIGLINREVHSGVLSPELQEQFLVTRHITGFGQERGGFLTQFKNNDPAKSVDILFFESVPWFLKLYLHTLRFEQKSGGVIYGNVSILSTEFQPAIDRVRPSALEIKMTIPARSEIAMRIDFDIAFIKYTEHPPDANRGFDVSSSVVTILDGSEPPRRIYTNNVLIALPTPDFSMPYNVITMTCTVMALYFGSLFNVITRQFAPVRAYGGGGNALQRLLGFLRRRKQKVD